MSRNRLVVVILLLLLVAGGAAVGLLFGNQVRTILAAHGIGQAPAAADQGPPPPPPEPPDDPVSADVIEDVPDMTISLESPGSTNRYLKVAMSIRMRNKADKDRIHGLMPRVQDAFQVYMRDFGIRQLAGAQGINALRSEFLKRINEVIAPAVAREVFFREVLVL